MGIINRRNAVVGWIVLKVGKRAAKKKAQAAAPGMRARGTAAGGLAALGGLLFFWKKKRGTGSE